MLSLICGIDVFSYRIVTKTSYFRKKSKRKIFKMFFIVREYFSSNICFSTEGQCAEEKAEFCLPKFQMGQVFELPEKEGRCFDKCVTQAKNRLPNVQAIFHSLEGECIGYFAYDLAEMELGTVGNTLCILPEIQKLSDTEIAKRTHFQNNQR